MEIIEVTSENTEFLEELEEQVKEKFGTDVETGIQEEMKTFGLEIIGTTLLLAFVGSVGKRAGEDVYDFVKRKIEERNVDAQVKYTPVG